MERNVTTPTKLKLRKYLLGMFIPPVDLENVRQAIFVMTASPSKTQGFITYWIWTNLLTCCVLKFQCNGQMHGVRLYTKTCSTKRICRQCQHSVSKWKAGGKHLKRICDHLALIKHKKNTKTHNGNSMDENLFAQATHTHKQKHTWFTIFPTLSVIKTFIDYRYTHP